ncbi:hypothetical protein [Hoeflea sp.]|uniref:hypothetical protein n=1 Tax=Hoeflea sp. TaxID=1940281 RepID=UPI0019AE6A50|nr:hypothetical protein [Hoeflea sp.]MBC7280005.1 hypothetical protein [Hoeflea sp.]
MSQAAPIRRLAPDPVWSFRPDGSVRDLAEPDPVEIDFFAMANGLSKIARFNGSNPGVAYSVAQHSVMGADAILNETGDTRLAALFLLHDGEEYLLGDKPTPAQRLLVATIRAGFDDRPADRADFFWDKIKREWREAGWIAAGLGLPNEFEQAHIDDFDRRMCNAEMVALFGPAAKAQAIPVAHNKTLRLKGGIKPWAPMKAEERFIEAAKRLVGEETLYEQRALHATHVELSSPHGSHAADAADPAAARQTIAGVRSDACPSGRKSSDRTGRKA